MRYFMNIDVDNLNHFIIFDNQIKFIHKCLQIQT